MLDGMRIVTMTATALLLAVTAACSSDDGEAAEPLSQWEKEQAVERTAIRDAADACVNSVEYASWPFEDYVILGDGDLTATITHPTSGDIGTLEGYDQVKALECFLDELDVTDAIDSQMSQTTAMMGRQEAEWGDFEISWSYHPDSGVAAVVTETPAED